MREVMMKAQELAQAILDSEVYQHMHALEDRVTKDEEAAKLVGAYMEKRNQVERLLHSEDVDAEELSVLGRDLQAAEDAMNNCQLVQDMRDAQSKFQDMMENINRILRLVVTGDSEGGSSGCTGNCASCGGCN